MSNGGVEAVLRGQVPELDERVFRSRQQVVRREKEELGDLVLVAFEPIKEM